MKQPLLLLLLAAFCLTGCSKIRNKNVERKPIIVDIAVVGTISDAAARNYVGQIESANETSLHFPLGGQLLSLCVKNGDRVRQGQLLAEVDSTQAKSMHDAAVATLRQAQDGYQRLELMYKEGALSEVKWVEMQTNLEKAIQQEITTRKTLDDCRLTAVSDGVVSGLQMHIGQTLLPGQTLCTIVNTGSLRVVFTVPEQEISTISKGDHVRVSVAAADVYGTDAIITEKSISAGALAHTYEVKAALPSTNSNILPGMVAKTVVCQQGSEGIVVPAGCVQTTQEGPAIWVVRQGNAQRIHVCTTSFVKNGVLVGEGLIPGDTVITAGYQKLYRGAPVSVRHTAQ